MSIRRRPLLLVAAVVLLVLVVLAQAVLNVRTAALVLEANPGLTTKQLKEVLLASAHVDPRRSLVRSRLLAVCTGIVVLCFILRFFC